MTQSEQATVYQVRSARLLLLLTFIHSIPVLWLTPVGGGTVPTVALLAFGVASLFTFDSEGVGLGLFALLPALVYLLLAWLLAWLISKALARLSQNVRLLVLAILVGAPLVAVYFPIYVFGGHSSSGSLNLIELVDGYLSTPIALTYWIGLHMVLALLYAGQCFAPRSGPLAFAERWVGPLLKLTAAGLVCFIVVGRYQNVICRPLAELGNDAAQICVARADTVQARYWYERAAADGNVEAITWLIEHTPDRQTRLEWLRKGAEAGDAAIQYQLSLHLKRYGDAAAQAEAVQWLDAAVAGNHGPAQQEVVERLTKEVIRTGSPELLRERNALLERAVENGSPLARQRLAEHYARGSMGYPVDMMRSRDLYRVLAERKEASGSELRVRTNESAVALQDGGVYEARMRQLDAWQAGLTAGDPEVIVELAKLYLGSPLPGPGVHENGLKLFEQVAADDPVARQELIVMLRTGTDGAVKDLPAARKWLLRAAEAGDVEAMDRAARNYLSGYEGFPVDYPKARFWIEALVDHFERTGGADAPKHLAGFEQHLRYIERLDEMAGGSLLGESDLASLARATDAESQYRYALQLLAGHGASRRAEAVSRLQTAAALDHAEAAWRLVGIYERGFPDEINPAAARRELERAVRQNHFYATRELAARYEYGKKGFARDLDRAIELYEGALAAGRDNRYGWNLDPDNYNHFSWLESRLRQARLRQQAEVAGTVE